MLPQIVLADDSLTARPADSMGGPSGRTVDIVLCEFVALSAELLQNVVSAIVLARGYGLQMIRVDTTLVATEMVDDQSSGDRTHPVGVGETVSKHCSALAILTVSEVPIPVLYVLSSPLPTPGVRAEDLVLEVLLTAGTTLQDLHAWVAMVFPPGIVRLTEPRKAFRSEILGLVTADAACWHDGTLSHVRG